MAVFGDSRISLEMNSCGWGYRFPALRKRWGAGMFLSKLCCPRSCPNYLNRRTSLSSLGTGPHVRSSFQPMPRTYLFKISDTSLGPCIGPVVF